MLALVSALTPEMYSRGQSSDICAYSVFTLNDIDGMFGGGRWLDGRREEEVGEWE